LKLHLRIKYRDSNNFGYKWRQMADRVGTIEQHSLAQGQIDSRYHDWVQELDRAIRHELAELTQQSEKVSSEANGQRWAKSGMR